MTKQAKKQKAVKVPKQAGKPKHSGNTKHFQKKKTNMMLFGIRTKIFVCFLIPILFLIFVGTLSYQKAAEGMKDTFCESSQQTIRMAGEYIDVSNSFIGAEALKYAFDSSLGKYLMGLYEVDPIEKKKVVSSISSDMRASQPKRELESGLYRGLPKAGGGCRRGRAGAGCPRHRPDRGRISLPL